MKSGEAHVIYTNFPACEIGWSQVNVIPNPQHVKSGEPTQRHVKTSPPVKSCEAKLTLYTN